MDTLPQVLGQSQKVFPLRTGTALLLRHGQLSVQVEEGLLPPKILHAKHPLVPGSVAGHELSLLVFFENRIAKLCANNSTNIEWIVFRNTSSLTAFHKAVYALCSTPAGKSRLIHVICS